MDGQQRLTTLYLIMLAAAQLAARTGEPKYARGLIGTNLYVDWAQDVPFNTKLVPSIEDRPQFRAIFEEVARTGDLQLTVAPRLKLPYGGKDESGPLTRQFTNIKRVLNKKHKESGFDYIETLIEAARNGLTFVFILLKDPGSATTVFEGLNDPGVPISVGDLVKNEVFARKGYDAEDAQHLHDSKWVPFFSKFGPHFNDYFFPYAVIQRSNTSKTDMFKNLRETWRDLGSEDIINHLEEYSQPYLALNGQSEQLAAYPKQLRQALENLYRLGQPASALPFEMRLISGFERQEITRNEVVKILSVLESFFVRRAICGVEPTGLLGMFRSMWSNMDGHPTAEKTAQIILRRQTVEWPTDARLAEQIRQRPLYGSSIARYVVFEFDRSFGADQGDYKEFTVEHVLPQAMTDEWGQDFSKDEHAEMRDLWANLLPLTSEMNGSVSQSAYAKKRPIFQKDSMFASAREFAKKYRSWDPNQLLKRCAELEKFSKTRWPRSGK